MLILNVRGETAVGGGWVARGRRLLETQPDDIVERGYLLAHEFFQYLGHGDFGRAAESAAGMVDAGRRFSASGPGRSGFDVPGPAHDLRRSSARRLGAAR